MSTQLEWSIKLQDIYNTAKELKKFTKIQLANETGETINTIGKYLTLLTVLDRIKINRRGYKIIYEII